MNNIGKTYIVYDEGWPVVIGTMAEIARALEVSLSVISHAVKKQRAFGIRQGKAYEIFEVE